MSKTGPGVIRTGSGKTRLTPGYDQSFTLPRGTSAAPIKQATSYKPKKKLSSGETGFIAGATGAALLEATTKAVKKKPITKKGWGKAYKRGG